MAALSVGTLCLLHRAVIEPDQGDIGGRLRSVQVWIGNQADPIFVPPAPEDVPRRIAELVDRWRRDYPSLAKSPRTGVVAGLARLHHGITELHPFLDGNGRLARVVIDLAAQELLAQRVGAELTADRKVYFSSLRSADAGDFAPLEALIEAAAT
jgi:Fic family protein